MGDILNLAAVHDNGLPCVTIGIRGNSFRLSKVDPSTVAFVDPKTGETLNLKAKVELENGETLDDKFSRLEDMIESLSDHVKEEACLENLSVDGFLLVDDEPVDRVDVLQKDLSSVKESMSVMSRLVVKLDEDHDLLAKRVSHLEKTLKVK